MQNFETICQWTHQRFWIIILCKNLKPSVSEHTRSWIVIWCKTYDIAVMGRISKHTNTSGPIYQSYGVKILGHWIRSTKRTSFWNGTMLTFSLLLYLSRFICSTLKPVLTSSFHHPTRYLLAFIFRTIEDMTDQILSSKKKFASCFNSIGHRGSKVTSSRNSSIFSCRQRSRGS